MQAGWEGQQRLTPCQGGVLHCLVGINEVAFIQTLQHRVDTYISIAKNVRQPEALRHIL